MAAVYKLLQYFPITFTDIVECGGYIWFSSINSNGLYKLNYADGKMEYLGKFPEEKERFLFNSVVCYKNRLYFLPGSSGKIMEFDTYTRQFLSITVPDDYMQCGFYGVGQYHQFLFMWNYINYDIIRFDMEKKEFHIIKSFVRMEKPKDYIHEYGVLWRGYCIVGTHLYIPSPEYPIVLEVDMKKCSVYKHFVCGLEGYRTICYDGKQFWLSGSDNCLIVWNPDSGESKSYTIDSSIPFCDVLLGVCEQSIIYYSLKDRDEILMLNTDNMQFEYILDCRFDNSDSKRKAFPLNIILKKYNDRIWVLNCRDGMLQTLENGKRSASVKKLTYGIEKFIQDRVEFYFSRCPIIEKNNDVGIDEYLEYVFGISRWQDNSKAQQDAVGKRIYEAVLYK